jgi:molecular chaperone Hsp33
LRRCLCAADGKRGGVSESSSSFAPYLSASTVSVSFVRGRNAVLVRGELGTLFVDYFLHLRDHVRPRDAARERMLAEALALFTLHCAARPRFEHIAWTLNFQSPRVNLFLVGDNEDTTVVGRFFAENIKEGPRNIFYCDTVPRRGAETRRSVVQFDGADVVKAVEVFYRDSEQRPARYFELGKDEHALLVAHPDCDLPWFQSVTAEGVLNLAQTETLTPIERRAYRWHCGCTQEKILGVLAPACRGDAAGLFGEDELIRVQCPRCAAVHTLTREAMEAHVAQVKQPKA